MKILLLSVGDNGGGCYWHADAINKYTEHQARSVRFVQSWINYPYDVFAPKRKELEALMAWADILHIRDNVSDKWPNIPNKKPVVVTWTGMSYRQRAAVKLQMCRDRGWFATVSTPDLVAYAPAGLEPEWLPNAREEMDRGKDDGFTACHAPTFRERKGTDAIIAACEKVGMKLELIENKTYLEALKVKASCSLVVDQFTWCYGNNAIEAWAMGQPVISGTMNEKYNALILKNYGTIPYLDSTEQSLPDALSAIQDEVEYKKWADIGGDYFYRFHHAPAVAKRLVEIYERAI